ncbi:hypothetical protein H0E87_000695 [Populus deltoides]|uniref:Uncharacterized protein n=1 Tax=Populus deltoides TaxID=3696 RepID=A0A8T2ZNQ4_POPDE|nr:hypothetical protein H0E87_000695 [Populus deltoides]
MWVSLTTLWHMQNIQHKLAGQDFLISTAMWPANHIRIGDLCHGNNQPIYPGKNSKGGGSSILPRRDEDGFRGNQIKGWLSREPNQRVHLSIRQNTSIVTGVADRI